MADYKTIKSSTEGFFKDKGSKFTAYLHPVSSEQEAMKWVKFYKENQPSARHHCYAYRIGPNGEKYRAYDDGEPGGTAGKPIFNQLLSHELTNIVAIVVRYFGGTKLGVSGLIQAYKESTIDAINQAIIIEKELTNTYKVSFTYDEMPLVMKWTKQNPMTILEQQFDMKCVLDLEILRKDSESILGTLPRGVIFKRTDTE